MRHNTTNRHRWPLVGAAVLLASLASTCPARAQDGAPPVPRPFAPGQSFPLDLQNVVQSDSIVPFGPKEMPATATVHVDWMTGPQGLYPLVEPAPSYVFQSPAAGFAGEYTLSGAHVDFSLTTQVSATDKAPFTFTSSPDGQRVLFAQVGHEEDGIFVH